MNFIETLERLVKDNASLVPHRRMAFGMPFRDYNALLDLLNACKRAVRAQIDEENLAPRVAEIARYLGRLEGE
jgi:hypothetical protein